MRKPTKNKIEHWQTVVDHVNDTWKKIKGVSYNYPWRGKDIQDLAHQARNFQPWGIMALWDIFLERSDEYTKERGYGLDGFFRSLPWLLDKPWKARAETYQRKHWPTVLPPKISELTLFTEKFKPKKRYKNTSRSQWLLQKQQNKTIE